MAFIKVNGVDVSPSPSGLQLDTFDITDGDRNASAKMVLQLIAKKHKLTLKWKNITQSQLKNLLSLIEGKLFFNVTYQDMDGVTKTIVCYKGDRSGTMFSWNNGNPIYESFSVNFIEQ